MSRTRNRPAGLSAPSRGGKPRHRPLLAPLPAGAPVNCSPGAPGSLRDASDRRDNNCANCFTLSARCSRSCYVEALHRTLLEPAHDPPVEQGGRLFQMLRYRGLELRLLVEQRPPQTGEPAGVPVGKPACRVRPNEPTAAHRQDDAAVVDFLRRPLQRPHGRRVHLAAARPSSPAPGRRTATAHPPDQRLRDASAAPGQPSSASRTRSQPVGRGSSATRPRRRCRRFARTAKSPPCRAASALVRDDPPREVVEAALAHVVDNRTEAANADRGRLPPSRRRLFVNSP